MQEFQVIQAVVLSVVLVEVTADKVREMDKARVNKGCRSVTKDDRLEFRNRVEGGELDEVGNKLEPARRNSSEGNVKGLGNQLPPLNEHAT